ncbi:hypothetical protein K0U91_04055 [Chryseobacterium chendengshani]|uniref:hypothetical protein n=1 Tax=Chryseobacterium sp. LJ668 TaxID=2864040 RepID=UPI001C692225|nr:hypothetical protein [Chryseobacterium sp. LJ668]MBW8524585.1 hypothetical protein [Chryseobacterium sp. LJ668]QYK17308.1 hypothetical protein K0U91_04055 [Chryseobacterium sp. LJ668]
MKNHIKKLSLFAVGIFFNMNYGQSGNVGINTENPQQKLHVSGVKNVLVSNIGTTSIPLIAPTVRIDGLNSTNNSTVFSAANTTNPLYVNTSGDTSVKKGEERFSYFAPQSDAITTGTTLNVTAVGGYVVTGNLLTVSFTLNQRSMVFFSSVLTADVRNASGGTISDGNERAVASVLQFTSAPASSGIPVNTIYASDGLAFANRVAGGSVNTFKLNSTTEIVLPAGSYTVVLKGAGICANQAADNFRVIFGAGSGDRFNILAKPL